MSEWVFIQTCWRLKCSLWQIPQGRDALLLASASLLKFRSYSTNESTILSPNNFASTGSPSIPFSSAPTDTKLIMAIDHPYFPAGLDLPGYHPPLRTFGQTTGLFFAICGALAVVAIAYSRGVKHFSTLDKFLFCWWVLTGSIHLFLEGGFAVFPEFGADTTGNIMAELCAYNRTL